MSATISVMKDFNDMTGPELARSFNAMVEEVNKHASVKIKPVNKFENLVTGIHRCQMMKRQIDTLSQSSIPEYLRRYDLKDDRVAEATPSPMTTAAPSERDAILAEADSRWRNWQPIPGMMTRPRKSTFARIVREERREAAAQKVAAVVERVESAPNKPSLAGASRTKNADRVIRITVEANPRRRGTDAYDHFELMKGAPTVGEYLAKFKEDERNKARQWLTNTVRDGFAKLLG